MVRRLAWLWVALAVAVAGCMSTDLPPRFVQVTQLGDTWNDHDPYTVWATVAPGDRTLKVVVLYWRLEGQSAYQPRVMTSAGTQTWQGAIPAQPQGTNVYYFLWASDGQQEVSMPAATPTDVPLKFRVLRADEAPVQEPGVVTGPSPAPTADVGNSPDGGSGQDTGAADAGGTASDAQDGGAAYDGWTEIGRAHV